MKMTLVEVITTLNKEVYIEHHGVKGQKWGVRKRIYTALTSMRKKKAASTTYSGLDEMAREKQFIKEYRHRDKMSTKAIQARTNRLRAENEFKTQVYAQQNARKAAELRREQQRAQVRRALVAGGLNVISQVPVKTLMDNYYKETYGEKVGARKSKENAATTDAVQGILKTTAKGYEAYAKALANVK
jgi:hypothetical protein